MIKISSTALVLRNRTQFVFAHAAMLVLIISLSQKSSFADKTGSASPGFSMELPNSEADVTSAVQTVVDDHVIRGTYVYEREKILNEATAATSSAYFGSSNSQGHVFYKTRKDALAPRNFKNSSDIGVITVRYLVSATSPTTTHLEISAVFVEDGTHRVHPSESVVETSEFAEIQKQLFSIQKDRQMAAEIRERKESEAEMAATLAKQKSEEAAQSKAAESSLLGLQERANELQHALEVRVQMANTELKAAPFHAASTLAKLPANSDVLVEILTTYWYGIETADGHRGWIRRDQVVPLP